MMRILFVSSETPLFPLGGISTYLQYMVPALKAQGHDVFLFTFRQKRSYVAPDSVAPFDEDKVHFEFYEDRVVNAQFPSRSRDLSVSFYIAGRLEQVTSDWQIDVVESTDWQAPCLGLFQKVQAKKDSGRLLLSVYNHGLSEFIWEADQRGTPDWARASFLAERQQMRASDLVVVPSDHCRGRLKSLDIQTTTRLVREPYVFGGANHRLEEAKSEVQYMGRISIGKGVDKLIFAANIFHSIHRLRRFELIGRTTSSTFRESDIIEYVKARLHPDLRDRFSLIDFVPRDAALDLLQAGVLSPHLGSHETFSYACVEAIGAGQIPIVRHETPMAEFFPEDMQHHVLDAEMRSVRGMQEQFEGILSDAPRIVERVQEHCRAMLDPDKAAGDLGETYAEALDRKRGWRTHAVPRPRATIADVTVLVPAYKPNHEFMETVDSLVAQTAGIPKVLICDDGTPESHQPWFDYAEGVLPECTILRQPNAGLLASRNTLIDACETPLSIFVDTDDLFAPELLEHMLEAWNDSPRQPDAVIPQRRNFGESKELVLQHVLGDYLHVLENDYRMTALIRTDILSEIGFDATRRNGEADDWIFWLDFEGRGYRAVLLPEAGFLYRVRTGSMSWPWSEGQNVGTQTMLREVLQERIQRNSDMSRALTRAMFARAVSK